MRLKYWLMVVLALSLGLTAQLSIAKSEHQTKKVHKKSKVHHQQIQHTQHHSTRNSHKQSNVGSLHGLERAQARHNKKQSATVNKPLEVKISPTPAPVAVPPNPVNLLLDKTAQQVKQEAGRQLSQ